LSARGQLRVDGVAHRLRPPHLPFILQRISGVRVLSTTYVHPGDPVPRYPRLRRRLLVAAASAAVTTVGLLGASRYTEQRVLQQRESDTEERLRRLRNSNNIMFVSGVGAGVISATCLGIMVGIRR